MFADARNRGSSPRNSPDPAQAPASSDAGWRGSLDERFSMEADDRGDLGGELWNFQEGEAGRIPSSTPRRDERRGRRLPLRRKHSTRWSGLARERSRCDSRSPGGEGHHRSRSTPTRLGLTLRSPMSAAQSTAVFAGLERLKAVRRALHPALRPRCTGRTPCAGVISSSLRPLFGCSASRATRETVPWDLVNHSQDLGLVLSG